MQMPLRKLCIAVVAGLGMLIATAIIPVRAADDGDDPGLNGISGGGIASNALTANAVGGNTTWPQAPAASALIASGLPLGELNGVVVKAVTLPQALEY
jgi:hypothetical protein